MLAVSEKGRFLKGITDAVSMENKKFGLVLSSFDDLKLSNLSPLVKDMLATLPLLGGKPLFLPWWLHNRHLVLLLKRRPDADDSDTARENFELVSGFYYESRMLSRRVNPVFIKQQQDLEILLYIFTNYWHRAKVYTESLADQNNENMVPIIQNKAKMDAYIDELLGLWETSPA